MMSTFNVPKVFLIQRFHSNIFCLSLFPREVEWSVTEAAKKHTATDLTVKLAHPKSRTSEDYDPRAWNVSHAALHAQASPRLVELATPLPRKCRQQKS